MPFAWIQSVTADQLPDAPFRVNPYTTVVDSARWLATLQAEAQFEPSFWRIRNGSLQQEIEFLRELLEGKNAW